MRLNATEIDAKSSEPRTSAHRFGARDRIHHIVAAGGEHGLHHVVGEAAHIAQIELQTLAHEVRDRLVEVDFFGEAPLGLRAGVFRTRIGEQLARSAAAACARQ